SPIHSVISLLVDFITYLLLPLASSRFESLGDTVPLHGTTRRQGDCSISSPT
ncbi:hypothetical protein MTR67_039004, partial [Solanum verrucosum]